MIQVETLRSSFKLPKRFTDASIELKEALLSATKIEIYSSPLIEHYINHDWDVFAFRISLIDFTLFTGLLISLMMQFWSNRTTHGEEKDFLEQILIRIGIFNVAMAFLTLNLVKETLQIISEGYDYLKWENLFDNLALVLVSFC